MSSAPTAPDRLRLDGRTALVTGAGQGLGRAEALALAAAGARVVVNDYDAGAAEAVAREIEQAEGVAVAAPGDVSSWSTAEGLVNAAIDAYGRLDVLVNNAGVFVASPPLTSSYDEWRAVWERTLAVNLVGAANATFRAVPHLRAAGGGAVVNVSSRGAFRGEPDNPAYGASKAGMNAFAQSMALALAPLGISVTSVAPGFVQTEMAREVLDGPSGDAVRGQSPFGRVARPEEVASAVVWLASPEARFSSGTIVDVNGASYLRS